MIMMMLEKQLNRMRTPRNAVEREKMNSVVLTRYGTVVEVSVNGTNDADNGEKLKYNSMEQQFDNIGRGVQRD